MTREDEIKELLMERQRYWDGNPLHAPHRAQLDTAWHADCVENALYLLHELREARELLSRVRNHLNQTGTRAEGRIFGDICSFLNRGDA